MDDNLKKIVEKDALEFFEKNLILPVLNAFFKYDDERCYNIFTKELADILRENKPDYFYDDYHSKVGRYYFSSLWGDHVPEELLIEILQDEDDERFEGVDIYFDDHSIMDELTKESVDEMTIKFNFTKELINRIALHHLNSKR